MKMSFFPKLINFMGLPKEGEKFSPHSKVQFFAISAASKPLRQVRKQWTKGE